MAPILSRIGASGEAGAVHCGATVTTAASAGAAIERLREVRPHAIVTDIAMPDDGVWPIRKVMEMVRFMGIRIPVIAVTAYRFEPKDLLRIGFAAFVSKPLDPLALCTTIRDHVAPA
jgi:CheY-like chemotaxis protein